MDCSTLVFPVHYQLPEIAQTHVHWVGDAIQPFHLYRPLLLLPSVFPSIGGFSNESALCIRMPKYWSFSFSISSSNEYSGLISFRINRFDLLAVQGTFKGLHQHHSSKVSICQCSAFFIVQLSHPYMTTGKTITRPDRVPDELWMEVCDVVQDAGIKTIPEEKKCKKAKWLSDKALQTAMKRRQVKGKGGKESSKE